MAAFLKTLKGLMVRAKLFSVSIPFLDMSATVTKKPRQVRTERGFSTALAATLQSQESLAIR